MDKKQWQLFRSYSKNSFFAVIFCFVFPSLHKQIETLKTGTRPLLGRAGSRLKADCIIRPKDYAKTRRLKSRKYIKLRAIEDTA